MAVYKVIQDIEAEDKLLGPLTLKGFIYAMVAGVLAFVNVRLLVSSGPASVRLTIIFILLFPMLLFGILAAPLGRDQPTEVWLLSHVRFFLKNRKRVWNQSGINQLVIITVPKKIEKQLTKGFSQTEIKSRLQALAATLDSRGWAIKNVDVDMAGQPRYFQAGEADSDRLVGASSITQDTPVIDIHASDDIMDEQSNATAHKFNELMQVADTKRKQKLLVKFNAARQGGLEAQTGALPPRVGAATWQPPSTVKSIEDEELGDPELYDKHPHFDTKPSLADERKGAIRQQEELEQQRYAAQVKALRQGEEINKAQAAAMKTAQKAVNIDLAQSGNDLSVASIAQLANRSGAIQQISPDEVVIKLH